MELISKRLISRLKTTQQLLSFSKFNYTTTKPAPKLEEDINTNIEICDTISRRVIKHKKVKKPQRPPFAKNLFLGKIDEEILTYPQLEKEELETLEAELQPIRDFFGKPETHEAKTFDDDLRRRFRNLILFGLRAPQLYDGRQLGVMETCRFLEVIGEHSLYKNYVQNENLGIQAILNAGSSELKAKYLPGMISGKLISACCLSDADVDAKYIPKASKEGDGSWLLSGTRRNVINALGADLFIVLAETSCVKRGEMKELSFSMFIVEKEFPGVFVEEQNNLSSGEVDLGSVKFDAVRIPQENILGMVDQGPLVVAAIIDETRLGVAPACIAQLKELIRRFGEEQKELAADSYLLTNSDSICTQIGDLVINLYAMESITYLTAGLMDQYEDQDCTMEAALVRNFCTATSTALAMNCMNYIGPAAYTTSHWSHNIFQRLQSHLYLNEGLDNLKLIIALLAAEHAGKNLAESVKKYRNPFLHPANYFLRQIRMYNDFNDTPKLNLGVKYHLHPSLETCAKLIEYSVKRLQFATEIVFVQYGAEVINAHYDLKKLADVATDVYAMIACVGRASRSYCIGLQHGAEEILIATTFCNEAVRRVKWNVEAVLNVYYQGLDGSYRTMAKSMFHFGTKYFPVHPLNRNF